MIWTVNRLKEKQEASMSESPKAVVEPSAEIKTVIVAKKTIWEKFVHECKHYYSGFKLLFLNVRVSSAIIWKILQGQQLTRRESKQVKIIDAIWQILFYKFKNRQKILKSAKNSLALIIPIFQKLLNYLFGHLALTHYVSASHGWPALFLITYSLSERHLTFFVLFHSPSSSSSLSWNCYFRSRWSFFPECSLQHLPQSRSARQRWRGLW